MAGRRKKTAPTYILRRMLVGAVTLGVIAGIFWFVSRLQTPVEEDLEPESSAPYSELEASSEPSLPEPEESSEPEPAIGTHSDDSWRLILASPSSPVGMEYAPPELEYITGDYAVDSRVASPLRKMIADAKLEGVTLVICSAYRSADYQATLHNNKIDEYKGYGYSDDEAVATASTIVVPPGTSEHQTGLAVDIVQPDYQVLDDGFADTVAAKWLYDNAWKYGFILRYPKDKTDITNVIFEPWHYRYVGEEHAAIIREKEICLEEYLLQTTSGAEGSDVPPEEESMVSDAEDDIAA